MHVGKCFQRQNKMHLGLTANQTDRSMDLLIDFPFFLIRNNVRIESFSLKYHLLEGSSYSVQSSNLEVWGSFAAGAADQ